MQIQFSKNQCRIGTRGSLLARTQTDWVAARLRQARPELEITIHVIETTGDRNREVPFAAVGTKGMFVKEIEQALLDGAIDLGVHSLKDMPGELPEGLSLVGYPAREDPRDALISRHNQTLEHLPQGATVGTSSLRRQAMLKAFRPDLNLIELRGNLDTRLRKLDAGQYDAIVLACAGLHRLGLEGRITERISPELCVPAPGQGALALEARSEDFETLALVSALNDVDTIAAVTAERAFQIVLGAGCTVPVGAFASVQGDRITLHAAIAAADGSRIVRQTESAPRDAAEGLGTTVGQAMLAAGGAELLKGKP